MVNILEIKTTQAMAIKIVTEPISSLIKDATFDFYPYYIEDDTETEAETEETEKKKTIGGIVLKELNKTAKILCYMKLNADQFDVYKYNYKKKKIITWY